MVFRKDKDPLLIEGIIYTKVIDDELKPILFDLNQLKGKPQKVTHTHPAVRVSASEAKALNLSMIPICLEHTNKKVGHILSNSLDGDGYIRITASITDEEVRDRVRKYDLNCFSVGYDVFNVKRNINGKLTDHGLASRWREVSLVKNPLFKGCQIMIRANENKNVNSVDFKIISDPTSSYKEIKTHSDKYINNNKLNINKKTNMNNQGSSGNSNQGQQQVNKSQNNGKNQGQQQQQQVNQNQNQQQVNQNQNYQNNGQNKNGVKQNANRFNNFYNDQKQQDLYHQKQMRKNNPNIDMTNDQISNQKHQQYQYNSRKPYENDPDYIELQQFKAKKLEEKIKKTNETLDFFSKNGLFSEDQRQSNAQKKQLEFLLNRPGGEYLRPFIENTVNQLKRKRDDEISQNEPRKLQYQGYSQQNPYGKVPTNNYGYDNSGYQQKQFNNQQQYNQQYNLGMKSKNDELYDNYKKYNQQVKFSNQKQNVIPITASEKYFNAKTDNAYAGVPYRVDNIPEKYVDFSGTDSAKPLINSMAKKIKDYSNQNMMNLPIYDIDQDSKDVKGYN